jgi:cytochrome c biogenesis protein
LDEKYLQFAAMMRLLGVLGSLRLTLAAFVFLAAGILIAYFAESHTSPWLVASLVLLGVNLLAAILTRPYFRQQVPLLVFHLALLLIILLIAYGRLSYFNGRAEVVEGTEFSGELEVVGEGPWHRRSLDQARFANQGFSIAYGEGLYRLQTRNRVSWAEASGERKEAVIGDHVPLVLAGYRFYTTANKGFALVFDWQRPGQPLIRGSINLPSYPANALTQAQQWVLPGMTEPVWVMLELDEDLIKVDQPGEFRLPEDYRVVLRYRDQRYILLPGLDIGPRSQALPGGRLIYAGMRSWMGYKVTYDPTLHWLLAAAVLAVLALGWHFWHKFTSKPWDA